MGELGRGNFFATDFLLSFYKGLSTTDCSNLTVPSAGANLLAGGHCTPTLHASDSESELLKRSLCSLSERKGLLTSSVILRWKLRMEGDLGC